MSEFVAFARACGLDIVAARPSDKIQRCATIAHPRAKNGAFLWDGDRGWAMAWDDGGEIQWFRGAREWTEDDKARWRAQRDAQWQRQLDRQRRAARNAAAILAECQLDHHGYLRFKGLPGVRALCHPDESLLVPMRDARSNKLTGLQRIRWLPDERRWEKKMFPGMRAKGAVLRLGRGSETILCEGFATGLSIELAVQQLRLNAAVLVCFSAQNLMLVAPLMRGRAIVFADHDESGVGEEAARATGLPYCMADAVGWDANDLHCELGLLAVCQKLMQARS